MPLVNPRAFALAVPVALLAEPALAHHMMGGALPQTVAQGLLSGLGHPIIGIDHLVAIIGVGIIAATISRGFAPATSGFAPATSGFAPAISGFAPALAFSAAMIGGVAMHLARAYLPAAELLVGLSTVAVGLSIVASSTLGVVSAGGLFAMAGLVHGYALGESIVGAEPTPLGAYLVGLLVVQSLLAGGAFALTRAVAGKETALRRVAIVAAGALIAVVGGSTIASASGVIG
jgi:urease accessory protein